MSVQENKAFVRRYLDALSGKDKPRALQDEYIADSDEDRLTPGQKASSTSPG